MFEESGCAESLGSRRGVTEEKKVDGFSPRILSGNRAREVDGVGHSDFQKDLGERVSSKEEIRDGDGTGVSGLNDVTGGLIVGKKVMRDGGQVGGVPCT